MHNVCVCTGSHQARAQRRFKHVGASSGIFTDNNLGFLALSCAVVPAQETADLYGMFKGQVLVGFAPEPVRTEIFTHITVPPYG